MTDQDFMSNIMHQVMKMKGLLIGSCFFSITMHRLVDEYRNENLKLGLSIRR